MAVLAGMLSFAVGVAAGVCGTLWGPLGLEKLRALFSKKA